MSNLDIILLTYLEECLHEDSALTYIAAQEHKRWANWQAYMFSKCTKNSDGSLTVPTSLVLRWQRQIDTIYADLSNKEQESDIEEAKTILGTIFCLIRGRLL